MSEIKLLTTGQAARYCHVSQATIVNWIKKDKLKAYTTPGGHHRILLSDFLSFLETYKMPVDSALTASSRPRVLIVSDGPYATVLAQTLQKGGRFDVALASKGYEASAQVARFEPDAAVLDLTGATPGHLALCRWLCTSPEGEEISVLAIGGPEDEEAARAAGVDAYLPSAAVAERLEAKLETLLELRLNSVRGKQ